MESEIVDIDDDLLFSLLTFREPADVTVGHVCQFTDFIQITDTQSMCQVCKCINDTSLAMVRNINNIKTKVTISSELNVEATVEKHKKMCELIKAKLRNPDISQQKLGISDDMVSVIASRVLEAQIEGTNNRGECLHGLMAGCALRTLKENGGFLPDNIASMIFTTKGGVSPGRNTMLTVLGSAYIQKGLVSITQTSSAEEIFHGIKSHLMRVDLYSNRQVFRFVHSLVTLHDLLKKVESQTLITRSVGSIYYYFVCYAGKSYRESMKIACDMALITKETVNKYFIKLVTHGPLVDRIAKQCGLIGRVRSREEFMAIWMDHKGSMSTASN